MWEQDTIEVHIRRKLQNQVDKELMLPLSNLNIKKLLDADSGYTNEIEIKEDNAWHQGMTNKYRCGYRGDYYLRIYIRC